MANVGEELRLLDEESERDITLWKRSQKSVGSAKQAGNVGGRSLDRANAWNDEHRAGRRCETPLSYIARNRGETGQIPLPGRHDMVERSRSTTVCGAWTVERLLDLGAADVDRQRSSAIDRQGFLEHLPCRAGIAHRQA